MGKAITSFLIIGSFFLRPVAVYADDWWDDAYVYRVPLQVINQSTEPFDTSITVSIAFDHRGFVDLGVSQPDGDDVRLVYQGADGYYEIDRVLAPDSSWNRPDTVINFQLQEPLVEEDDNYFLYFDNQAAQYPLADPRKVYLYYEDFEDYRLGSLPEDWQVIGDGIPIYAETTDEYAYSGTKSVKITGTNVGAVRRYFEELDYTARVRFLTFDNVTEGGIHFRSDLSHPFHPSWLFQIGSWWYAGGGSDNRRVEAEVPEPEPGSWMLTSITVVGDTIISGTAAGTHAFGDYPAPTGHYLGLSKRVSTPVYYDDLIISKAVDPAPVVRVGEPETWEPELSLAVLDDSEFEIGTEQIGIESSDQLEIEVSSSVDQIQLRLESLGVSRSDGLVLPSWDGTTGWGLRIAGKEVGQGEYLMLDGIDGELRLSLEFFYVPSIDQPAGRYQGVVIAEASLDHF